MAGKGKPGPPSTERKVTTLRFWHYDVYAAEAARRGISFTQLVNEVLAEKWGLAIPDDHARRATEQLTLDEGAA